MAGFYEAVIASSLAGSPACIEVQIGNGVDVISTGVACDVIVPYSMSIKKWTLISGVAGDISIDIWKDSYGNAPPTDADTIFDNPADQPILSAAAKSMLASAFGTRSESVLKDSILRINVDSAATVTRVTLALEGNRL